MASVVAAVDGSSPASTTNGAAPPKRRFIGRSPASSNKASSSSSNIPSQPLNAVPSEILQDQLINASINALLPKNYSFEIHKTIHQIRKFNVKKVALQMPEGLAMFGTGISDLIEMHTDAEAVILADVTYGACCVDDYTARALGCDMLVHYGHSCLIPIDTTAIRCLYVFVEIGVDTSHLLQTILLNFPSCLTPSAPSSSSQSKSNGSPALTIETEAPSITIDSQSTTTTTRECHLAVVGTVQFLNAVHGLKADLEDPAKTKTAFSTRKAITASEHTNGQEDDGMQNEVKWRVTIPQVKPLSPGEILGCTAPKLPKDVDGLLYIGDGRFHLESIMIANPHVPAFRYDPYSKKLTREGYEHDEMLKFRGEAVATARQSLPSSSSHTCSDSPSSSPSDTVSNNNNWGVVLGTLGRQGSLSVLKTITSSLPTLNTVPILLSELSPAKLAILAPFISAFVQTSCPRLSIDWGYAFPRPLLSTYEASVALGKVHSRWASSPPSVSSTPAQTNKASSEKKELQQHDYPMDFYADMSLGAWTPRWHVGQKELERKRKKEERDRAKAAALFAQQQQQQQSTMPHQQQPVAQAVN